MNSRRSCLGSMTGLSGGVAVALLLALVAAGTATAQTDPSKVTAPVPTVPEIYTLQGQYVRMAYNNEGFATLGYRMVQENIGKEWALIMVGITLRKPAPDYKLTRAELSITTPDGKTIPLATQAEYQAAAGALNSLNQRAKIQKDSIDYFPLDATQPCSIQFFADMTTRALAWDEVDLSWQRACVGRLYFKVPGGIQIGQHWLNIKYAGSSLQVPFRTLTDEEAKMFKKNWQELKKQHDALYK